MTNTKRKPLVPITREFLKQFYHKFPLEPVPEDVREAHMRRIEELAGAVAKPGSKVPEQIGMLTPTRIDDCFWRNRMICEELALSVLKLMAGLAGQPELAAACERCHSMLISAERSIFAVQEHNTTSVKLQLKQFIPQDFRGALLESRRVSTEAKYKKQIEDLVKKGGSIRLKYDLYLQQQWERRQSLVQLGECSGMYKMVIKFVAGIPQVLLDFAKEINAKLGPMEEQRIKYGPDLYGITTLGLRLDVCLAAWAENAAAPASRAALGKLVEVVEPAVGFYCEHMLRVVSFIGNVFQCSPFFVNKDDLEGHAHGDIDAAAAAGPIAAAAAHHKPDGDCASSVVSEPRAVDRASCGVVALAEYKEFKEAAGMEVVKEVKDAGGMMVNGFKQAAGVVVKEVKEAAEAIANGVKDAAGAAKEGFTGPEGPVAARARLPLLLGSTLTSMGSAPATPDAKADAPRASMLSVCPSGRDSCYSGDGGGHSGEKSLQVSTVELGPLAGHKAPPLQVNVTAASSVAVAATAAGVRSAAASDCGARSAPADNAAAAPPPPLRQPQLVHVDTPSPHLLSSIGLGSNRSSHAGGGGGRTSLTGESVVSFASAEDDQPWHNVEDGFVVKSGCLLVGCFKGLSRSHDHEPHQQQHPSRTSAGGAPPADLLKVIAE